MNLAAWNKLIDLLRIIIRAPYRSRVDAERLEACLDEIQMEVQRDRAPKEND